ncbi:MAG: hypothetical protein R2706_16580 [Acidimicrobiales bacterium]
MAQVVNDYERELYLARIERDELRRTKRLWTVIDEAAKDVSQSKGSTNPAALAREIDDLTQQLWAARDALEGALGARGSAQGQLAVALGELEAMRLEHEEWEARLYEMHEELETAKKQLKSPSFQLAKSRAVASKAKRKLGQ